MASASQKRRRARKRHDEDGDPEFQVAPMVDVLLVLLLFFMSITSTELLKKERNLTLPDANNAKKDKDENRKKHEAIVNVTWDGINSVAAFSMDGVPYPTADAFVPVLAARYATDPRLYVMIRSDRDVQYSNISDLMHACASAGIGTVTFGVITGAPTPPPEGGPTH